MRSTEPDRVLGWRSRFPVVQALLAVAAMIAVWQGLSSWLSGQFSVPRPLIEAGTMLVLLVALILDQALRRSAVAIPPADHQAGRNTAIGRFGVILYALAALFSQVAALCRLQPGSDPGTVLTLTLAVMMGLTIDGPGRVPLFRPLADGAMVRPGTVRTLSHGFAALAILSLAALVYDGIRPGTLPNGIGIALAVGILVLQVGFWRADRRTGPERQ